MFKSWALLGLFTAGLGMVEASAPKADGADATHTDQLIQRLGSSDFDDRVQAMKALYECGPGVLPALRVAADSLDAEVRWRVRELIRRLEIDAALEPQRVSLAAEQQSLRSALGQMEKQAGVKIDIEGMDDGALHRFGVDDAPFWDALDRMGRESGRAVFVPADENGIQLKRRKEQPPFAAVHGPFRLELTKVHEDRDADFSEPGADGELGRRAHRLTLTVSVLAEPRFILLTADKPQITAAVGDDDKRLEPAPLEEHKDIIRLSEVLRRDYQYTVEASLWRASNKERSIKTVRGAILVKVVVERKPIVFTEHIFGSEGTKCQVGGDVLEITRAPTEEKGFCGVELAVPEEHDGLNIDRWRQRLHIEDAEGHPFKLTQYGSMSGGHVRRVTISCENKPGPAMRPPSRLIVEDWTIVDYEIPFEFNEVPLP